MWTPMIVALTTLLFIVNLGESVGSDATPSTSKSVGDNLPISMPTDPQYIKNGSRLDVTCRIMSSKPDILEFRDDDLSVVLTDTDRRKINISQVKDDSRGEYVVGNIVWDPVYVKDNKVRTIRCRNKDSGEGKTFKLVVIPDVSEPKVEIVKGNDIQLERKVKQHRLVCNVTVKVSDVVSDFEAEWIVGKLKGRGLPSGLSQEFKKINPSTGSVILTINDSSVVDKKKLFCVSKLKFKELFEVVRDFRDEANVTVVGDFETISNSIEYKTKAGEDATLDCKAVGKTGRSAPVVKWWKKDEYVGTEVAIPADINTMNERYSHSKTTNPLSANNSIILIREVTYKDRSQFVCQAEFHDRIVNTTFTLRVADPFGPLWPVLGIIAEALVMVVIIWYTEFRERQAEKKKEQGKGGKPLTDGDNAPLMKSNADGANEVNA